MEVHIDGTLAGTVEQVFANEDTFADIRAFHLSTWENVALLPDTYVFVDEGGAQIEDEEGTLVTAAPIFIQTVTSS